MTSRILVVDMLQSDVPVDLITGLVVLHAEKFAFLARDLHLWLKLCSQSNRARPRGFHYPVISREEHIWFCQGLQRCARTHYQWTISIESDHEGTAAAKDPHLSTVCLQM